MKDLNFREFNSPEGTINFMFDGHPMLIFKKNGDVFIRGEKVDNNFAVYEAIKDFLIKSGYPNIK